MVAKYKRSNKKNIVTITRKSIGKAKINERELMVFEENLLPGFFRPRCEGKRKLVYTAPLSVPLKTYVKNNFTIHKFYNVLAQLIEIIKKIDRYKFYLYNLVLDMNLIYVKETTGEIFFLYEPLISRDKSTNVFAFLGDMVHQIKTDDKSMQTEIKQFEAFLCDSQNYRIEDIEQYIQEHYPQIYQQIPKTEDYHSGFITSSRLSYQNHYQQKAEAKMPEEMNEGTVLLQEDGTTLLQEEGTVLLTETTTAEFIRSKTGEEYVVQQNRFVIGKSSDNDCVIRDNKAISRQHAAIIRRNGTYYLVDEGATNHTYLNGIRLIPKEENELHNGDEIRLADEEFQFYIK